MSGSENRAGQVFRPTDTDAVDFIGYFLYYIYR